MYKKNEINIIVAMEREAKPLINYWNLKKKTEKIFSNKKKKIHVFPILLVLKFFLPTSALKFFKCPVFIYKVIPGSRLL